MELFRSILYVPGSRPSALEKAPAAGADVLVFDLEDAVAPDHKTQARQLVAARLSTLKAIDGFAVVRINDLTTPWGGDDLAMVNAAKPRAVLIPKVEAEHDLSKVESLLAKGIAIWAMLETPRGLLQAEGLAQRSAERGSALTCLVLGLNDLSSQTHAKQLPGRGPMLAWLSHAVLVARARGLNVIDGVFNALHDPEGLRLECDQACQLGFDGKSLIHPNQVRIANDAFTPSADEIAHARAVIQTFEALGGEHLGAVAVNGQMVELLHLDQARRVMAQSVA